MLDIAIVVGHSLQVFCITRNCQLREAEMVQFQVLSVQFSFYLSLWDNGVNKKKNNVEGLPSFLGGDSQ